MSVPSFVCIGESMAMFAPEPLGPLRDAETLRMRVAGAESNVAISLVRLGFPVQWVSRLGNDPFGDRIFDTLTEEGVGLDHVTRDPDRPTGLYFKDADGGITRVWYHRAGSAASALDRSMWQDLDSPSTVHLSGITAALSESGEDLVRWGLETRPVVGARYSFDVNYRPALMPDPSDWMRDLAALADIVFVGFDEAEALWGCTSHAGVRAALPEPNAVIVKDAEKGATAFVGDDRWFVPAHPIEVVEPVGAGDAFAAGYLAGEAIGLSPERSLAIGHDLAAAALVTTGDVGEIPEHVLELFGQAVR